MEIINLLGKDLKELNELCIKYDFPKFHSEQLYKWMYQKKVLDISKMTNVPKSLKDILTNKYNTNLLTTEKKLYSQNDDTINYHYKTNDNNYKHIYHSTEKFTTPIPNMLLGLYIAPIL